MAVSQLFEDEIQAIDGAVSISYDYPAAARYDGNADGVHPSTEGRWIMAKYWRQQLVADGLLT